MKTLQDFFINSLDENDGFITPPSDEDFQNRLFTDSYDDAGIEMMEGVEVEQLEEAVDYTYASGVKKLIKAGSAVLWVDSGLVGEE